MCPGGGSSGVCFSSRLAVGRLPRHRLSPQRVYRVGSVVPVSRPVGGLWADVLPRLSFRQRPCNFHTFPCRVTWEQVARSFGRQGELFTHVAMAVHRHSLARSIRGGRRFSLGATLRTQVPPPRVLCGRWLRFLRRLRPATATFRRRVFSAAWLAGPLSSF